MFIISKLFTYLFLPPGIFILILIFAGFMAKRFKWLFLLSALFNLYPQKVSFLVLITSVLFLLLLILVVFIKWNRKD